MQIELLNMSVIALITRLPGMQYTVKFHSHRAILGNYVHRYTVA